MGYNDTTNTFIPYIGEKYRSGINDEKEKVLIIGPRHYCDARYDSRNLISSIMQMIKKNEVDTKNFEEIHLTDDETDSIGEKKNNKYISFKGKIGCLRESSKSCLKDSYSSKDFVCPVLKDQECPLKGKCPQTREERPKWCNGNRQLRCETILAIHDYTKGTKKIPSAEIGCSYFASIEEFLKKFFPNLETEKNVWERIAFMNMIQRYVPYRGINESSIDIAKLIRSDEGKEDKKFVGNTIAELSPTYIIATMKCVEDILRMIRSSDKITKKSDGKNFSFDEEYKRIKKIDGFIVFKLKDKNEEKQNGRDKLLKLNPELVFRCFLEFYRALRKNNNNFMKNKSLRKTFLGELICTFLHFGYERIKENFKEYSFADSDIRNILLDYIVYWKCHLENHNRCTVVDPDIIELLELLNTNRALCTFAHSLSENGVTLALKNKDKDNPKEQRKQLCRKENIQKYATIHSEDDSKFKQIFEPLF